MKLESDNRAVVHIEQHFHHPAEEIFDAWLTPELLGKWMFGPTVRKEEIIHLTNDPRPGGRFSYKVKRGDMILDHIGTYLEIVRPIRLVFTWGNNIDAGDESTVTISIQPSGEGCTFILQHDMDIKWAEHADRIKASWSSMLEILDERLSMWDE
ncbi:SRPBCC family protein [Chitinophaga vietnamensis]|uniref:SRPBCC family protein n=1 Tax=Chitinophaga vietnamensis TaxID=2593957 RepID=UPI001177E14F|nr:SRPBCC family protein [Chitinophaga vietnamensis]